MSLTNKHDRADIPKVPLTDGERKKKKKKTKNKLPFFTKIAKSE